MTEPTEQKSTKSPALAIAFGGGALAFVALVTVSAFAPPLDPAGHAVGYPPIVSVADGIAAQLNSAGNSVFASLRVSDATGVAITPADAGVMTTVAATPLAAGETDGSGCITAVAATGLFTIANVCGAGQVELVACFGDVNAGNTAAVATAGWSRTRAGVTSVVSHLVRKAEVVDAGTRTSEGCVAHIAAAQLGDTYQVTTAVTVNGAAVTLRDGFFYVRKLSS